MKPKNYKRVIDAYDPGDAWFFSSDRKDWHTPLTITTRRKMERKRPPKAEARTG